jgi:hypothetical protein
MPKIVRATKIEKEERSRKVQLWILEGKSDVNIIKEIRENWELSSRQGQRYLTTAYDGFRKDQEISIESKRSSKIAELQELICSMKEAHKGTPAGINALGRIHKQIIRLQGTESVKRHLIELESTTEFKGISFVE